MVVHRDGAALRAQWEARRGRKLCIKVLIHMQVTVDELMHRDGTALRQTIVS